MNIKTITSIILLGSMLTLVGCGNSDKYYGTDYGFKDGYGKIINTVCYPETTHLYTDAWDSPTYSINYNKGQQAATTELNTLGCPKY